MKLLAANLLLLALIAGQLAAQDKEVATEETRTLSPERQASILRQATLYFDDGQYQAALRHLENLPTSTDQNFDAENLKGVIYIKLGRLEEAREIFQSIVRQDPLYLVATYNLGELQFIEGNYPEALEHFRSVNRRDPRNEELRFQMILCLVKLDQLEEAKKLAQGFHPSGSTPAWYYIGAVMAKKAGDSRQSKKYLATARAIYGGPSCSFFDESLDKIEF